MKNYSSMLLTILVAAALMLMYRAHMELRYNSEALAWQVKCENEQLKVLLATDFQRTRRDATNVAGPEVKFKVSAAGKNQID